MTERDRLFLGHVLEAVAAIESFTAEGKAVKNLSPALVASETAVPWRLIAGTRDRLLHGYFKVDLDAVWSMVEQDLPPLKENARRILGTT